MKDNVVLDRKAALDTKKAFTEAHAEATAGKGVLGKAEYSPRCACKGVSGEDQYLCESYVPHSWVLNNSRCLYHRAGQCVNVSVWVTVEEEASRYVRKFQRVIYFRGKLSSFSNVIYDTEESAMADARPEEDVTFSVTPIWLLKGSVNDGK